MLCPGLDPGTEKGYSWKTVEIKKKKFSLVNSILPMIIS